VFVLDTLRSLRGPIMPTDDIDLRMTSLLMENWSAMIGCVEGRILMTNDGRLILQCDHPSHPEIDASMLQVAS
jgi:hypothetical protein